MRQPYGTESTAETVLTEFYRQLAAAEARHAGAKARIAGFDSANPDHWDLIAVAGEDADAASDQMAEIEREITGLENEMHRCFRWAA